MSPADELRILRYLAGPQPFAGAPDARDLSDMRARGLARDEMGRIELTDAGRTRLEELEKGPR